MRALLKRKQAGWLAVSFRADRIDIAHIQRRIGGRPSLLRLESYARGADDAEALKVLKKTKGLGDYQCTTLMAPGSYQVVQVDAPDVPAEELREAVRWKLKDALEFGVESATVDVVEIPVGSSPGRQAPLLAVAANNAELTPRMIAFSKAKLSLAAVDISEMAQRNIASLLEDENRGLAMLTFDDTGGLLTFTFRGELCVARRIEVTSAQLDSADETRRVQLYERIGLELQRSMDNFERQYTTISISKIVLGPAPFAPGLLEHLREYVYLPVVALDLASLLDCATVPEISQLALQAERLTVIGAALRDEGIGGKS